jgi:hypothetical protein
VDLSTVLAKVGRTLVETRRKTPDLIYEPANMEGRLMEMGIQIQRIDSPYRISVEQKVPPPLSHEVVKSSYLHEIDSVVSNSLLLSIIEEGFSEPWIFVAVRSRDLTQQAKKPVMEKKYRKTLFRCSDSWGNEEIRNHAMNVTDSRLIPKKVREVLEGVGLVTTSHLFKRLPVSAQNILPCDWTVGMKATAISGSVVCVP